MKNKKKKLNNKKFKKKILKFLKDYITVITFFVSGIGLILNIVILYIEKSNQTEFEANYYIQKITNIDEKNITGKNETIIRHMSYATYNNEINIIINKYKEELKDYYVIYLILEQTDKQDAKDVKLSLQKKGQANVEEFDINDLEISEEIDKDVINLDGIFKQNDGIKIPVAICEFEMNYMKKGDCIIEEIKPLTIEYKNKYLFSKRIKEIRDMYLNIVTFEGEIVNGRGSS